MIEVQINNKQQLYDLDQDFLVLFKQIVTEAVRIEGYDTGEISIALVNNKEIQKLNKKYLERDYPTDVLSFPMEDDILGDIVISVEMARNQAQEYGHSFKRELCYLLTHGILHILGYDHENTGDKKIMRQKEERILSKFTLSRD